MDFFAENIDMEQSLSRQWDTLNGSATPLIAAAIRGLRVRVETLLDHGASVTAVDSSRKTALHHSAYFGHPGVTTILLGAGAVVDEVDGDGITAFIWAATQGWCEVIMRVLLAAGADVNHRPTDGKTALWRATCNRHLGAVKMCIKAGANPVWTHTDPITFPLDLASEKGHTEIMTVLLDAGVVDNGDTLRTAISAANIEVVQLLLGHRADDISTYLSGAKSDGTNHWSPLLCCFRPPSPKPSSIRMLRLLLDAGADTRLYCKMKLSDNRVKVVYNIFDFVDIRLSDKQVGRVTGGEKLCALKAMNRLLKQKEAVLAVSWRWPSFAVARAGERWTASRSAAGPRAPDFSAAVSSADAADAAAVAGAARGGVAGVQTTRMMLLLRSRAARRGVVVRAMFR